MKKSLRVKGIDPAAPFGEMARLITRDRMRRVMRLSKSYLETHEEDDLHQLRMAFRRLRYPMEAFVDCFPPRLFNTVLDRIDLLQEATGQVRDLDFVLDQLRTRANGSLSMLHAASLVAGEDFETRGGDGSPALEDEESGDEDEGGLLESIRDLEAERARRVEVLDGALTKVLGSAALRRFRRELKG